MAILSGIVAMLISLGASQVSAQVVINEICADNGTLTPQDINAGTPDLLELYNDGEQAISLGSTSAAASYYLSDTAIFDSQTAWKFPTHASRIEAGGFLTLFCDAQPIEGLCELHPTFSIASDGSEPLTLWGPRDGQGNRPIVDQVWLPPLRRDVSFGRFPDGAGPAPVPVEETMDNFVYNIQGSASLPSFGMCEIEVPATPLCTGAGGQQRFCEGAPNGPGVSLQGPRVRREDHSSNAPEAMEPVDFTVRVSDPDGADPDEIELVQIRYQVDGGATQSVDLVYDAGSGVISGAKEIPPKPLKFWTLWTGRIPGQPAGAKVEFHFYVRDRSAPGLESTRPRTLCSDVCPDCDGPCDREFGGDDCMKDTLDITCRSNPDEGDGDGGGGGDAGGVVGERYIACDNWFSYVSGYESRRPELLSVLINEVVPAQDGLLLDDTQQRDCRLATPEIPCRAEDDACCPAEDPRCCDKREDFIELTNSSDETIDLTGLWLTDSYFEPQKWQFPEGSKILAGEYLIIWLDNDGGQCPQPSRPNPPCFWECPDPTDTGSQEYHTNFALDLSGDQIYLVDDEEGGFGILHGLAFSRSRNELAVSLNESISLLSDGDRGGCYVITETPTPGAPNVGECAGSVAIFRRGDASNDCGIDLSDAVFVLNWLFLGGTTPSCQDAADANDSGGVDLSDAVYVLNWLFLGGLEPAVPGPTVAGPDPTEDILPECVAKDCP